MKTALLVVLGMLATAAFAQSTPAELEPFQGYLGAWKLQEQMKEGPGNAGEGRFRWGPGRRFVIQEVRTTGPNGTQEAICIYGFDTKKKRLFAQWYASHRTEPELLRGEVRDGVLVFEGPVLGMKGEQAYVRITLPPPVQDRFEVGFAYGPSAKALNQRWHTVYTRAR